MYRKHSLLGISRRTWRRRAARQAEINHSNSTTATTTTPPPAAIHHDLSSDSTRPATQTSSSPQQQVLLSTDNTTTDISIRQFTSSTTAPPSTSQYGDTNTTSTHPLFYPTLTGDAGDADDDNQHIQSLTDISSDEEEEEIVSLQKKLQAWAIEENIKLTSLTKLLKILRETGVTNLPSDGRTLLHTPTSQNIVRLPPGDYCHLGLNKAIQYFLSCCPIIPNKLQLDFNVDGVPLSRSSTSSFWLILVRISAENYDYPQPIFVVGVYHGNHKPKVFSDFLAPFIDEAKNLETIISNDNNALVAIGIRCIIADAPARNACLGTKYYNGHYGCGRCTQKGVHDGKRMTFPESTAPKRTNVSFRTRDQPMHHISECIFERIPNFDVVQQFDGGRSCEKKW